MGCSKNSTFRYFTSNWNVSPLFECFVVFICICLTFTQSQCSHAVTLKIRDLKGTRSSFVQANHLLNKIPQIISKAIFRTSLIKPQRYAFFLVRANGGGGSFRATASKSQKGRLRRIDINKRDGIQYRLYCTIPRMRASASTTRSLLLAMIIINSMNNRLF